MFGSLLTGGLSLIGSILGNKQSGANTAAANAASIEAAKLTNRTNKEISVGDRIFNRQEAAKGRSFLARQAQTDRELQTEFAKNSAGWQFDDLMESADQAGIHRLSAIGGAGAATYSPVAQSGPVASSSSLAAIAPDIHQSTQGSSVGEGFGLLADISGQYWANEQQKEIAASENKAREAEALAQVSRDQISRMVALSEVERNRADTELLQARSRSLLAGAGENARGGTRGGHDSEGNFHENYKSRGEETTLPIGPDLDQVITGFGIDFLNKLKARYGDDFRSKYAPRESPNPPHRGLRGIPTSGNSIRG